MRKVAIVKYIQAQYGDYYDNESSSEIIATNITEWEEVTDEQFGMLQKSLPFYATKLGHNIRLMLIEKIDDQKQTMENSVKAYLDKIAQDEADQKRKLAKYEADKEEKKKQRELKQLERLKAQYEKK